MICEGIRRKYFTQGFATKPAPKIKSRFWFLEEKNDTRLFTFVSLTWAKSQQSKNEMIFCTVLHFADATRQCIDTEVLICRGAKGPLCKLREATHSPILHKTNETVLAPKNKKN
jgi:hypothetical protein